MGRHTSFARVLPLLLGVLLAGWLVRLGSQLVHTQANADVQMDLDASSDQAKGDPAKTGAYKLWGSARRAAEAVMEDFTR